MAKVVTECSVAGCGRAVTAKGYCYGHYRRFLRGGDLSTPLAARAPNGQSGMVSVPTPRVPPHVLKDIERMAEVQGITTYELLRRVIMDWYDRAAPKRSHLPAAPSAPAR